MVGCSLKKNRELADCVPTPNLRRTLRNAEEQFVRLRQELLKLKEQRMPAFRERLTEAGAPWIPGQEIHKVDGESYE